MLLWSYGVPQKFLHWQLSHQYRNVERWDFWEVIPQGPPKSIHALRTRTVSWVTQEWLCSKSEPSSAPWSALNQTDKQEALNLTGAINMLLITWPLELWDELPISQAFCYSSSRNSNNNNNKIRHKIYTQNPLEPEVFFSSATSSLSQP